MNDPKFYRPDIDGLRAIAVMSVLIYHYSAPFPSLPLPGGFTGVDVFFVISGFLITSKLNDDIAASRFSVLDFYDRRVRRILPALIVMLAVTLFAGKFLLMPGDYQALASSTAAAAFGVSNFYFLANTDYFDQSADLLPLLHTWSLAVEEQFYVAWPLLLFAIASGRKRVDIVAVMAGIVIVGFAVSLLWFDADPKGSFYMVAPRAWELAIGAVLVFLPPLPRVLGELAGVAGLALIGAGFASVSAASFPGVAALAPCVGAALVIWPRLSSTISAALLGLLRPIGLISYSLYLWHWPVWVMFRIYINGDMPNIREALAVASISTALAILSYFFAEKPFRTRRLAPSQSVWVGIATSLAIVGASAFVYRGDGIPDRISPGVYAMRSRDVMWKWSCPETVSLAGKSYCALGSPWQTSRKGILWGDSHAQHLAPLLDAIAKPRGVSILLEGDCPAALGHHVQRRWPGNPGYEYDCSNVRRSILQVLDSQPIEFVILASAWTTLATTDLYADDGRPSNKVDLIRAGLADTLNDIKSPSRKISIVADMTGPGTILTDCVIASDSRMLRRPCPDGKTRIDSRIHHAMFDPMNNMLSSFSKEGIYVDRPIDTMCSGPECILRVNGEFIWMDYSHLRRNLSQQTDAELARILKLDSAIDRSD
jgi:peptidoglycan/LPS O-acetylase OafA/YrhL